MATTSPYVIWESGPIWCHDANHPCQPSFCDPMVEFLGISKYSSRKVVGFYWRVFDACCKISTLLGISISWLCLLRCSIVRLVPPGWARLSLSAISRIRDTINNIMLTFSGPSSTMIWSCSRRYRFRIVMILRIVHMIMITANYGFVDVEIGRTGRLLSVAGMDVGVGGLTE